MVLHEVWGLNDDIRGICSRFADAGYAAVAPDLYSGGLRPACMARTFADMSRGGGATLGTLDAVRDWLASRDDVDGARIGAAGFCMGGGFALLMGTRGLRATSVAYGRVPRRPDDLAGLCPVVASYGSRDRFFLDDARRLERFCTELGIPHDIRIYDGVGHSFMNTGHERYRRLMRPVWILTYDPGAAGDAWERILTFFARHLSGAGGDTT